MNDVQPCSACDPTINKFEIISANMTENEKWLLAMVLIYVFGHFGESHE